MPERVAAIDIGTNSTRLLVAEAGRGAAPLQSVERLMRITRLGQDVDRTGRLAPEAIERTVAVLREYRGVMDELGVAPGSVRMTATSASRDAANRDDFFDAAEAAVGVRPELLSGGDDLSDMATTIEAEDVFDLATCPHPIRAPTTILAGSEDRWYTRELFEETARLIPGSRLRIFEGRGHVSVGRDPGFRREVEVFAAE